MPITDFKQLLERAKGSRKQNVAVAGFDEEASLAVNRAEQELGLGFVVFDWRSDDQIQMPPNVKYVKCANPEECAFMAAKSVSDGECSIAMKGFVSTSTFLKAILDKRLSLRGNGLMSHLALFELPSYHKILGVTDGGMVIAPTLEEKVQILSNAIAFFKSFAYSNIKVAALCAEERPNPDMPCTMDAACLSVMSRRGQFGFGVTVDGPLSFDLAFSSYAAQVKGVESEVTGDADILLVPDIEAGNLLGKSFSHACNGKMAGIVLGARCPVVLPSRSDSDENKFYSLVAAVAVSGGVLQ
jgi:phosphate butyryltransferase